MVEEQTWFLYIVRCQGDVLYTGITNDVEKRVERHNKGRGSKFTAGRKPVDLVYVEKNLSQRSARIREAEIKKWRREKKEELIKG